MHSRVTGADRSQYKYPLQKFILSPPFSLILQPCRFCLDIEPAIQMPIQKKTDRTMFSQREGRGGTRHVRGTEGRNLKDLLPNPSSYRSSSTVRNSSRKRTGVTDTGTDGFICWCGSKDCKIKHYLELQKAMKENQMGQTRNGTDDGNQFPVVPVSSYAEPFDSFPTVGAQASTESKNQISFKMPPMKKKYRFRDSTPDSPGPGDMSLNERFKTATMLGKEKKLTKARASVDLN